MHSTTSPLNLSDDGRNYAAQRHPLTAKDDPGLSSGWTPRPPPLAAKKDRPLETNVVLPFECLARVATGGQILRTGWGTVSGAVVFTDEGQGRLQGRLETALRAQAGKNHNSVLQPITTDDIIPNPPGCGHGGLIGAARGGGAVGAEFHLRHRK